MFPGPHPGTTFPNVHFIQFEKCTVSYQKRLGMLRSFKHFLEKCVNSCEGVSEFGLRFAQPDNMFHTQSQSELEDICKAAFNPILQFRFKLFFTGDCAEK